MDSSFGRELEKSMFYFFVLACLVSAGLGIGGFLFVRWIIHHLAIHWR